MVEITEEQKILRAEKELMNSILANHLADGNAIGLWRLPNSSKKNLMVCTEGVSMVDELVIEEQGTGFAFAPFDSEKKKVFLKADVTYVFENGEVVWDNSFTSRLQVDPDQDQIAISKPLLFHESNGFENHQVTHQKEYIELVKKSIHKIESGSFEKLVPSRCKQIALTPDFDLVVAFNRLCSLYPDAFVSLVSAPETGTWLGASPELLVAVDDKMRFKTVAVAGTQRLHPEVDLKLVAWTQKEIEEQALVSRYIINCFKKIRLREFEESGPRTWKAGNLLHLKTEFEVNTTATNFPQLGSVMLKLLHPTSAVCGMPRDESLEFLTANEKFDRSYYSGYLGPVNYQNETHLFVNLRCMRWNTEEAMLYAGAGVTLDSVPEKEWEETEMKMNTLLPVIQF